MGLWATSLVSSLKTGATCLLIHCCIPNISPRVWDRKDAPSMNCVLAEIGKSTQGQILDPNLLRGTLGNLCLPTPRSQTADAGMKTTPLRKPEWVVLPKIRRVRWRGSTGLPGLMQSLLSSPLQRRPAPLGTAHHGECACNHHTGPVQLVQERYKSMTNICNLKIGQSFAII